VIKFDCPGLVKLNQLARLTLAFALERQLQGGDDEIRASFVEHFSSNGYPKAGAWLWEKDVVIRKPLLTLVRLPLAEKQAILPMFNADNDIEQRFAEGQFHFSAMPLSNSLALNEVRTMLINFYTAILSAPRPIPAEVINEVVDFGRQTVLRSYLRAQKLKVCPGCDGQPPSIDYAADVIREDIDHFFGKSKYPFLAIHPLNLTPLCKTCNQTSYKGQKDAILDQDPEVADVTTLNHIYHPYLRPACEEVEICVEWNSHDDQPHLFLRVPPNSPAATARLHSLNYLLRLESRWEGDLQEERPHQILQSYLWNSTQEERDQGIEIDESILLRKLNCIVETIQRSVGKIPGYAPTQGLVRLVADNPNADSKWLAITKAALHDNQATLDATKGATLNNSLG
jgi:hypothetical protein